MEPRRTPLCMLSGMLSSFLTLIIKHCNEMTYQLPFAPNPCLRESPFFPPERRKRANELGPEGVQHRRPERHRVPDDPRPLRAPTFNLPGPGRLARMLSLLDPELL